MRLGKAASRHEMDCALATPVAARSGSASWGPRPLGIPPVVAGGLHVSMPTAGLLVTAASSGAMVGAPLSRLATGGIDRKRLLIEQLALFTPGDGSRPATGR